MRNWPKIPNLGHTRCSYNIRI